MRWRSSRVGMRIRRKGYCEAVSRGGMECEAAVRAELGLTRTFYFIIFLNYETRQLFPRSMIHIDDKVYWMSKWDHG